jgi:uncharacterized protein (TIGR03437 family)
MRTTLLLLLFASLYLKTVSAQPYTITTIAGAPRLRDGSPATTAPLREPISVALDAQGNLYICDTLDNRIREVDTKGIISTYAGTGVSGYSGDLGQAAAAQLNLPDGIAFDASGNLYIADEGNAVIRRVAPDGTIDTIAGNGNPNYAGDNGPALSAQIDPLAVAVDKQGNYYIADANYRIRKVNTSGVITTIAGTGVMGQTENGYQATQAEIGLVVSLAVDSSGNIYLADSTNIAVSEISGGIINVIAGGIQSGSIADGQPATMTVMAPYGVALDTSGNLFISDSNLYDTKVWRLALASGLVFTAAGTGQVGFSGDGGQAIFATLYGPAGLAVSGTNLYIADVGNQRIREITGSVINTVAGAAIGDSGAATSAFLNFPEGIAIDSTGDLMVADTGNLETRLFKVGGVINSLGLLQGLPWGMGVDKSGNFYVSDEQGGILFFGEGAHVQQIMPNGNTSVIAGTDTIGFSGDNGPATLADLSSPQGLALDAAGDVYIADWGNERVRMVDASSGNITTVAGNGKEVFSGDNGPAAAAGMDPFAVVVDSLGDLFITDQYNNRIRKVTPNGTVTTVAGTGAAGYAGDGGPATAAKLNEPFGIALDSAGNMYIADKGNAVVRRVTANGLITTIAGSGISTPSTGDGGPATSAQLDPRGVTVDAAGNVYVTDGLNDHVRMLTPQIVKPATMTIVSGNGQTGTVGNTLAQPLVLIISDSSGAGVPGVQVTFTVSPQGAATIQPSPAITLNDGTVSATVTLGANAGPITITAYSYTLANLTFSVTAALSNSPSIATGGIVGAGLSNPAVKAISPNGIVTVFGANFAPAGASATAGLVDGQLPTTLDGVCVNFGNVPAPIFALFPTQINLQVPAVSPGSVPVEVITGCGTTQAVSSSVVSVTAQATTPEFFYFVNNSSGPNPIAAIDALSGAYIGPPGLLRGATFTPAKPDEYLTLFATGFGATKPAFAPGVLPTGTAAVTAPVSMTLGGVTLDAAQILYVGVSQFAGLYQVNIQVPSNVASGNQAVVITVGGVASPADAYIAVE